MVGLEVLGRPGMTSWINPGNVLYANARSRVRISNSYSDSFSVQMHGSPSRLCVKPTPVHYCSPGFISRVPN